MVEVFVKKFKMANLGQLLGQVIQPTQNKVYYLKFGQNLDQIVLFSKKIEFNQNVRLPLNSIQTF